MLYAADVFLIPKQNVGKREDEARMKQVILTKLASIQCQVVAMVMGAMKTIAMDALEVMVNLLPFHMVVDKHRHQAALHLAMLPESHPLHKPVRNTVNKLVKQHPTPLHDLMHRYGIKLEEIETIEMVRFDTQ